MSLRDFVDSFNTHLFESAMDDKGSQPLSGEIKNVSQLRTGDNVSTAD